MFSCRPSPATILFRNLHIRNIADLPIEHKETRGFSIAKLFSKFDYQRINHTNVFPWSFPLAWNLPSHLSRSHRPGAVPLWVPSSARWVASNSSGETLQVIQMWSSLSWFSCSLGPIGSEILPWDQPWSNRGLMAWATWQDWLSSRLRLMAKDIPYGTRDLAISPKSAKLPSKEQEKSTKSHAKDRLPGWMVPGQKHLCHLALSMPGVGCISVYIFCIPMHTIHFVARKVPRTHTTFWPFGYLKIRHTLKHVVMGKIMITIDHP